MKYKHALFLNPYIESTSTSIMGLFPPTGLEYVATSVKGFVDRISLVDLRHEKDLCDIHRLLNFIHREKIDIICVSITWNRQFKEICGFLNMMPNGIPLVVGGYKATEQVEELFLLCPNIHIIVRGEGEETMKEILKEMPLENILGISYRKNGVVVHNGNRPLVDINSISAPDRSLRSNEYYLALNGVNVTNSTWDAVLTARGCPFNCKFCTFSLNPLGQKRKYSARSPESVVKELEAITANIVLFSDDNFCANPDRAGKICDLIIMRKIKKRFIAQTRIDIAKYPELLEKMVKAGFKILLLGIESPHDWILAQLDKGFNSKTIRKAFSVLKKYPIYYHGYFIYGNIGETEGEMLCISKFAKEIGVDSITFQKLRIDKFSPLRKLVEETPGYYITDTGGLYSDTYSRDVLKKIGKRIKYSFYSPITLLKISRKFIIVRLFSFRDMMSILIRMPLLIKGVIVREMHKKRLGDSLRRIFISNK